MQIFTYSCLEALNIGSQNRVSYIRRPFNPFQHCTVVCHLKNKPTRNYAQTLSHKCRFLNSNTKPSAFVRIEKPKCQLSCTLLPEQPTLKTQSWWLRWQADRSERACLSAGFWLPSALFPAETQWHQSLGFLWTHPGSVHICEPQQHYAIEMNNLFATITELIVFLWIYIKRQYLLNSNQAQWKNMPVATFMKNDTSLFHAHSQHFHSEMSSEWCHKRVHFYKCTYTYVCLVCLCLVCWLLYHSQQFRNE